MGDSGMSNPLLLAVAQLILYIKIGGDSLTFSAKGSN